MLAVKTTAGALTTDLPSRIEDVLMTARPKLPESTDKPPSGLNGLEAFANTSGSRLSDGPSTQTNSPSMNLWFFRVFI